MKTALKISLAFLTFTTYTHATWQPYLGLSVGLSKSQNTFKADIKNIIASDSITLNMDTTGTTESLFLGLCKQQKMFFFGGEIFTSVHQYNIKRKGNIFYIKIPSLYIPFATLDFEVNQKYSNGVAFLFGKALTSHMDVFLKFDFFWSKFTIKYVNSITPSIHGQENKWLFGYAPGVGVQLKLSESIATRFDYSYKIYNEFRSKNISQETQFANTQIKGNILPRIHQFALSLIYNF